MLDQRFLPDFRLVDEDGIDRSFHEYLVDFNLLAIRRVPEPSHGPATELLRRLLAEHSDAEDVSVRGFDIRSPDSPCETCVRPHIVFTGPNLATICDSDGSILRAFGVVGYDRFFVVRSAPFVIDVGSIEEIGRLNRQLDRNAASSQHYNTEPEEYRTGSNGLGRKVSIVSHI